MDPFGELPAELQIHMLISMRSRRSLACLIQASPAMIRAYVSSKAYIVRKRLAIELDDDMVQDAMAVILFPKRALRGFPPPSLYHHYWLWESKKLINPLKPGFHDLCDTLDRFCNRMLIFVEDYLTKALAVCPSREYKCLSDMSLHSQLKFRDRVICPRIDAADLNAAERRRLLQAFFRYELLCKMYYYKGMSRGNAWRRKLPSLCRYSGRTFHPWEAEAIRCVQTYLQSLHSALHYQSLIGENDCEEFLQGLTGGVLDHLTWDSSAASDGDSDIFYDIEDDDEYYGQRSEDSDYSSDMDEESETGLDSMEGEPEVDQMPLQYYLASNTYSDGSYGDYCLGFEPVMTLIRIVTNRQYVSEQPDMYTAFGPSAYRIGIQTFQFMNFVIGPDPPQEESETLKDSPGVYRMLYPRLTASENYLYAGIWGVKDNYRYLAIWNPRALDDSDKSSNTLRRPMYHKRAWAFLDNGRLYPSASVEGGPRFPAQDVFFPSFDCHRFFVSDRCSEVFQESISQTTISWINR
ncbi:hypothetical protein F5Y18DRAFT_91404 [Xylariaceae sp. FL1019]|nr:hypothetical protein F5Y18DRAFT_91404 [Xylariaceae sp. FL1019]